MNSLKRISIGVASVVVVMLAWELLGRDANPMFSSSPSAIWRSLVDMIQSGELGTALGQSLQSLVLGYVLAVVAGVPIGILLGRYKTAEAAGGFYFLGLDAAPLVAFIPLYILWFGLGMPVKVAIIVTFAITPVVINTWIGVRGVSRELTEVATAFCASESFILRRIVLPAALPSIMVGLRLGVGRAVVALAVAELFTAITGLGGLLIQRSEDYDTAGVFVSALIFMGLGIGITLVLGWLERVIAPWNVQASSR